eukprot:207099-Hanusia_phi.AAC.10
MNIYKDLLLRPRSCLSTSLGAKDNIVIMMVHLRFHDRFIRFMYCLKSQHKEAEQSWNSHMFQIFSAPPVLWVSEEPSPALEDCEPLLWDVHGLQRETSFLPVSVLTTRSQSQITDLPNLMEFL